MDKNLNENLKWKLEQIYVLLQEINLDSCLTEGILQEITEDEFNNFFEGHESIEEGMFNFYSHIIGKLKFGSCYLLELMDTMRKKMVKNELLEGLNGK